MNIARYISRQKISRAEFARRIGAKPPYVTMLCKYEVWPSKEMAIRIMMATDGQVTPNDLLVHDLKALKESARG